MKTTRTRTKVQRQDFVSLLSDDEHEEEEEPEVEEEHEAEDEDDAASDLADFIVPDDSMAPDDAAYEEEDEEAVEDEEQQDGEHVDTDADEVDDAIRPMSEQISDDELTLDEYADEEVARIPILRSVSAIRSQALDKFFSRVYMDLKVVAIIKGVSLSDTTSIINVFCTSITRRETLLSTAKVEKLLTQSSFSERKVAVMQKMVRMSIWGTTLAEVKSRFDVLDIIRVRRYSALHVFNKTPQFNCRLANIDRGELCE